MASMIVVGEEQSGENRVWRVAVEVASARAKPRKDGSGGRTVMTGAGAAQQDTDRNEWGHMILTKEEVEGDVE